MEQKIYPVDDFTSVEVFCDNKDFLRHGSTLAVRDIDSLNCDIHCLRGEERVIPYLIFSPVLRTRTLAAYLQLGL